MAAETDGRFPSRWHMAAVPDADSSYSTEVNSTDVGTRLGCSSQPGVQAGILHATSSPDLHLGIALRSAPRIMAERTVLERRQQSALAWNRYPKEVVDFAMSMDRLLTPAGEYLKMVDIDLDVNCRYIRSWLYDLLENSTAVAQTCASAMKFIFESFVPRLHYALSNPWTQTTVPLLVDLFEWSTFIKHATQEVRNNYQLVLNQMRSLYQCIGVSTDCLILEGKSSVRKLHEQYLESAQEHLKNAIREMEDCADFWLHLHSAELDFTKIRTETRNARKKLLEAEAAGAVFQGESEAICSGVLSVISGMFAGYIMSSDNSVRSASPTNDFFAHSESNLIHSESNLYSNAVWGKSC
jgi:hypothetical protein